jgi:hypothetical protein
VGCVGVPINVVETVLEDGDPHSHGYARELCVPEELHDFRQGRIWRTRIERERQQNHRERRPGGVGDPLHLLTLLTSRAPEPRHQTSH